MKIDKHYSLKRADAILALIMLYVDDDDKGEWTIEAYANCREQGYCLWSNSVTGWQISFAEHRNSDVSVVYSGRCDSHGVPDKATYKKARYFDCDQLEEAARFIIAEMKAH